MPPVVWALLMTLCFGASNVIIERKLATVSTLPLMVVNYIVLFSMSFFVVLSQRAVEKSAVSWPASTLLPYILVWAAIVLIADFCYFKAYHSGGSVALVTLLIIMIPVFAILIKAATGGGLPSATQLAAIPFAGIAIYLATRS